MEKLDQIEKQALTALEALEDEESLLQWRAEYLGKKSVVMDAFNVMRELSKEERPLVGKRANQVRHALESALEERRAQAKQTALAQALETEQIDVTLPGRPQLVGRLHPVTQTMRRIYEIFGQMGFQVYRSREVETDDYNFTYLNMPAHHPARDMWDTFYTDHEDVVLRTHTSPGQVHAMREYCPEPIRVILPGMCFRYEQVTARSEMQFTQVEGLAVGKDISFGDLKGTLSDFARRLFKSDVGIRFRASHFPFTEPSAEMDMECFICSGEGCPVCKHTGWLEILGSGVVHPNVLRYGGYDPAEFTGFAFGLGPERITMLLYQIGDIRNFWRNDLRFLEQF
ncbi:MAG: phenylalanine--tRNA ligase subunit alpha [Anaerolineales bacterium]|nr:phenylalanine--tRNA ligase subunit alpha [Anaerolineales bacterium]